MPTTQAPRVVSRRRAANKVAPARRPHRYKRFLKHPINSLWGLFSSVKTAIVLIALIAIVCILGIAIIQAPAEITSSPSDYAAWVAQDMANKYGSTWANIFDSLGLFTIFSTWYFKALMALLAVNVAICTLNRAPGIWYTFRNPAVRTNDRFYQNALARTEFYTDQDVEGLRRFFRKKRYRVLLKGNSETGTTYLYAYKNAWATLSTFVFHGCLVALMLAAVITGWHGFGENSMAQHLLPKPVFDYLQSLAGFSYVQPLPDGESGAVYPIGTQHNIIYRADQFVAHFNQDGQPTDFYTDVTLFQDGKEVAHHRVRVNDPLTYQGITFHQASFIMYAWITITDDKGNVIFNQKPVLDQHYEVNPNTGNSIPVNVSHDIPLPNIEQIMTVSAVFNPNSGWSVLVNGRDTNGNPTFCALAPAGGTSPVMDLSQSGMTCSDAIASLNQGKGIQLKNWNLTVKDVKRGTVLLITKDSGSPLIWPISTLLILSLCITFYFPHRRVWIRFRNGHVQFAGLKEHFINVQREFDTLARQILALDQQAELARQQQMKASPPTKAAEKPKAKPATAGTGTAAAPNAKRALKDTARHEGQEPEMATPAEQSAEAAEQAEAKQEVAAGE